MTVLSFVVSPIAGALSHRIPIRVLLGVGLAFVGVGLLLIHGVEVDSTWTALLAGFLVAGVGIGITNPGIGQAAIAVVPVEKSGMGSGINTTFRQVGIATGVAGARGGLPVADRLEARRGPAGRADTGSAKRSPPGASRAAEMVAPAGEHGAYVHAAKVAFVAGFNEIVLIAAIVSFVGAARRVRPGPLARLRAADRRPEPPGRAAAAEPARLAAEPAGAAAGAEVLLLGDELARRRLEGAGRLRARRGSRRRRGRRGRAPNSM